MWYVHQLKSADKTRFSNNEYTSWLNLAFLNWWQHEVYGVTSSELRRKPEAGTAHTGVSSHQPYSPSGDTSPEAPSPEVGSGIRNVPIVYPSGAAAPYASYSSNSSTSASSSSSSHRATYIPYSSLVSSHSKTVTVASVQSAAFDDDDIDAQCLAELEMAEKAYFEKKQREKETELETNRDRDRERDSAHDDQTTQPTQQQWSPTEVACNDLDMQIEPSHESELHSQDTADADADTDTHLDKNDQLHSQDSADADADADADVHLEKNDQPHSQDSADADADADTHLDQNDQPHSQEE